MTGRRWLLLLATVLMALLTARLGWWQLDRAAQKVAVQQSLDERRALPPLTQPALATLAADVPAQQHRRATLQGRWLAERTVYLDNRPMKARTGFYVVTPLLLDDGTAVLVQRGWLPRDLMDRTRLAPHTTPESTVTVQGTINPALARLYEFDAAASGPIRQNLDLDVFRAESRLSLRPWVLVQEDGTEPVSDGLLRQWPAPSTGVDKHHGYAFQWFSLCALTLFLYVWFQFIRPRRSRR